MSARLLLAAVSFAVGAVAVLIGACMGAEAAEHSRADVRVMWR